METASVLRLRFPSRPGRRAGREGEIEEPGEVEGGLELGTMITCGGELVMAVNVPLEEEEVEALRQEWEDPGGGWEAHGGAMGRSL